MTHLQADKVQSFRKYKIAFAKIVSLDGTHKVLFISLLWKMAK